MITNDLNPRQFLKMTKFIFFALTSGLVIFFLIVLYLVDKKYFLMPDLSNLLIIIQFILSCIFLSIGYMVTKMTLSKIDPNDNLKAKLPKYQFVHIIRLATCQGVGLMAVVCFLLTSNLVFLIFLSIAFLIMIMYYPTPEKIGREINLNQSEIEMFYN
jgi:hypothetical protein